jgi:hypothetical protein
MRFLRIAFIIIAVFFCLLQGILNAEQEYPYNLPKGLKRIYLDSGNKEQRAKYWRITFDNKWWLTPENLEEFTDIKEWMEDSGLDFNKKNLEDLTKGIHDCVKKIWEDARSKLLNCDTLKNHYNGETKKKFLENLQENPKSVKFRPSDAQFPYSEVRAAVDPFLTTIQLHNRDFIKIVNYYSKKLKSGSENIDDFNDPAINEDFFTLTGFLGHEMIHAFGLITGGLSYGRMTMEEIRAECEAHCLQGKCLDPNHNQMMSACDGDEDDTFCDDNGTCEFRKCNKKTPPIAQNNWNNFWNNDYSREGGSGGSREYEHSDNGDENFSYASAILTLANTTLAAEDFFMPPGKDFLSLNYYPDLLIYNKFNYPDMPRLLDRFAGFDYIHDYVHDYFSHHHKVLVIPSGELMGNSGSEIIKQSLKKYVDSGGVILCLAQQYDKLKQPLMVFFNLDYTYKKG